MLDINSLSWFQTYSTTRGRNSPQAFKTHICLVHKGGMNHIFVFNTDPERRLPWQIPRKTDLLFYWTHFCCRSEINPELGGDRVPAWLEYHYILMRLGLRHDGGELICFNERDRDVLASRQYYWQSEGKKKTLQSLLNFSKLQWSENMNPQLCSAMSDRNCCVRPSKSMRLHHFFRFDLFLL